MAETFTTLKSKIGDWLHTNTTRVPDTVRADLLNMAQRDLLGDHDLRFGEHADTFATVASQQTYTLPSDFSRPFTFWYEDPDNEDVVFLDFKPKDEFDGLYPDATKTDKPVDFTIWGNTLYLGKTPDRVLTINRNYYRILADLSDANPSNTFTDQKWEAIFFKALALSSLYIAEDPRLPLWQGVSDGYERRLSREHRRAWSTGRKPQAKIPG